MAIEINGLPPSHLKGAGDSSTAQLVRNEPNAPKAETGRPGTADTVSLTDTAARLQALKAALPALPVVDTQRVEALRKAVADGTYRVDSEKLAEKMVEFERAVHEREPEQQPQRRDPGSKHDR